MRLGVRHKIGYDYYSLIQVQNCIAYGPGIHGDMFESTRIIGQLQFEKARELYTEARLELFDDTKDAVEFRHQFVNMTSYKVTYDTDGSVSLF